MIKILLILIVIFIVIGIYALVRLGAIADKSYKLEQELGE